MDVGGNDNLRLIDRAQIPALMILGYSVYSNNSRSSQHRISIFLADRAAA